MPLNFEFKARSDRNDVLEQSLGALQARFVGQDHQRDTYFDVPHGRLKLREGNIENSLIHYTRSNIAGAKQSNVLLYQHEPNPSLKAVLAAALGIKVVVEKQRRIYFVNNVKLHFDVVEGLGTFVEVEAIDADGTTGLQQLQEQCRFFAEYFRIAAEDYEARSYSDMLLDDAADKG